MITLELNNLNILDYKIQYLKYYNALQNFYNLKPKIQILKI